MSIIYIQNQRILGFYKKKLFKKYNSKKISYIDNLNKKYITNNYSNKIKKYKEKRYNYYYNKTKDMNPEHKLKFEKLRETKLCSTSQTKLFLLFLEKESEANLTFLNKSKKELLLISFILNNVIKRNLENYDIKKETDSTITLENIFSIFLIKLKNKCKTIYESNNGFEIGNKGCKLFETEYEDYIDTLLLNSDKFLKIRLSKDNNNIKITSNIKNEITAQNNIQKENINKDQIIIEQKMLDLIDNPKLIWKNLKVSIKNCYIERYFLLAKIKKYLKSRVNSNKIDLYNFFMRINLNSEFYIFIKNELISNKNLFTIYLSNNNLNSIISYFNNLIKNLFKNWFYIHYINISNNNYNNSKVSKKNIKLESIRD